MTLSDVKEYAALRVEPLDEACREWNEKALLPVGYECNNLFLTDWDETDFGELDFYDLFDVFIRRYIIGKSRGRVGKMLETAQCTEFRQKSSNRLFRSF